MDYRRKLEEIALCLLLKQITKAQLDFLIDICIEDSCLSINNNNYFKKHIIPLLIQNFYFIQTTNLISEDKLSIIKTFEPIIKQTYDLLKSKPDNEFDINSFKDLLLSIDFLFNMVIEKDLIKIYNILKINKENKEFFQWFFDLFYLRKNIEIQYKIIDHFNFNQNEVIQIVLSDVFDLNGLPGVVYFPICFENGVIELVDKFIEIETSLETDSKISHRCIATTTVYDFYIQIMISYNINIELYRLYYNEDIIIEIHQEDFRKTLEQLLTEHKINFGKKIQFVIQQLPINLKGNPYFGEDNKMTNEIYNQFNIWWKQISNSYEEFERLSRDVIACGLNSQIKHKSIIELIKKTLNDIHLTTKEQLIVKLMENTSPCLLHFIIGFNYDKTKKSIRPYTRNTMVINSPKFLFFQSFQKKLLKDINKNQIIFFTNQGCNQRDMSKYNADNYQLYFTYWLQLNNCSSAYIPDTPNESFGSLYKKLITLSNKTEDEGINILSKILLTELMRKPDLIHKIEQNDSKKQSIDFESLYKNKYHFILYFYISCLKGKLDNENFIHFFRNYLKFPKEIICELEVITTTVFNFFKSEKKCKFDPNSFDLFIKLSNYNSIGLIWHFIEVINSLKMKKTFSMKYIEIKFALLPVFKKVLNYFNNDKTNEIVEISQHNIKQFLLFTATYYSEKMKEIESEFNNNLKNFFLKGNLSGIDSQMRFCMYYYLIKTNTLVYPIFSFKTCNIHELLISSIIIQLSTIDSFQSKLKGLPQNKNTPFSNLFKDIYATKDILNSHQCLNKFLSSPEYEIKLEHELLMIQNEIQRELGQDFINFVISKYDDRIEYKSDILIIKSTQTLPSIQNGNYILKGYWVKVTSTLELYYSYCKINDEWFIYTSNLKKTNLMKMPQPTGTEDLILIYVKANRDNSDMSSCLNPNDILVDEMIMAYPLTLIELSYTNSAFIDFFFKSNQFMSNLHENVIYLIEDKTLLNDDKAERFKQLKRLCRVLLTNYELESDINEYFHDNILYKIKPLYESMQTTKVKESKDLS